MEGARFSKFPTGILYSPKNGLFISIKYVKNEYLKVIAQKEEKKRGKEL